MADPTDSRGVISTRSITPENPWTAPLIPPALLFTTGLVADRYLDIPPVFSFALGMVALVMFAVLRGKRSTGLAWVYLALAGLSFSALYHHVRQRSVESNNIGLEATDVPVLVRLRGFVEEEPRRVPSPPADPLRSWSYPEVSATLIRVHQIIETDRTRPSSGLVRLLDARSGSILKELHAGDEVEIHGRLTAFAPASNPGEFDLAGYWRERGVHAQVQVRPGEAGVTRIRSGWLTSPRGWVGWLRGRGHQILQRALPDDGTSILARALLLGEGAPLSGEEWNKYIRTGIVHVLAISGQHLMVIALFLWFIARLFGLRQRHAAFLVAGILLGYAILTGGRPPAMRAAVVSCMVCGGLALRRPVVSANLVALAWLVVGLLQPSDLFEIGCQLSFLAFALLLWGVPRFLQESDDPLESVVDASRPLWIREMRRLGGILLASYLVCLIVWAGITPLAAMRSGLIAPAALLLGPPLTFLTSGALLAGFLVLILPQSLTAVPALLVTLFLRTASWLVDGAERVPVHVYPGEIPLWWVVGFYLGLFAVLTLPWMGVKRSWMLAVTGVWLILGLMVSGPATNRAELRCTFLSVGHGGAVVVEFPEGKTLLYDAGSLRGPEVASRVIAPFLWSRRIQRLDDVVLSHADLDHFNGLSGLADRFAIGRVLTSETFLQKPAEAVSHIRNLLGKHSWETVRAGDRLLGRDVSIEVLHPPEGFDRGNENARSLVLMVRHAGHSILLTGDLEGDGLQKFLQSPACPVDVLQAPHHGSARLDILSLTRWSQPGLVVSCQGLPRGQNRAERLYRQGDVEFWSTHRMGAITVRSRPGELLAETYLEPRSWRKEAGRPRVASVENP
ncbi:MAG: DNA internalization-related competence protein ComEC/Rec2 [Gemmataceae bacterium]